MEKNKENLREGENQSKEHYIKSHQEQCPENCIEDYATKKRLEDAIPDNPDLVDELIDERWKMDEGNNSRGLHNIAIPKK